MNHLQNEISPYLLAHATNPVDWYPWNETALNLAKSLNKPIFLSIGYSACHWCHVMEEESFKDPKVADFFKREFYFLKVDREERPDLDKIYMDALVAMTGSGGWPMSIFLTPDLIPFFAGTYFPPQARYNMPAFLDLLQNIQNAWLHDREKLSEYSQKVKKAISKKLGFESKSDVDFQNLINQSVTNHFQYMDKMNGGWGQQPKFPHPLVILFLLDQRIKLSNTQKMELKNSLDAMIKGGFYDLLRGGFHRYSTDQIWLVPHFEKMLYDNALLARVYLYAGILYKNDNYIQIATETLDYLVDEMQGPHGGFFSSQDADSAGEEGTYYTWDYEETRSMLPPQLWKEFIEVFNISKNGNFEGRNILRKSNEISLSKPLKDKLLELQSERERPLTDDKILADWNGLAISALSIAGRVLQNSKYTHSAVRAAEFVKEHLTNTNILHHAFRAGEVRSQAFLSDYSFMINGMLDLFMSTQDGKWLKEASQWTDKMVSIFWDGNEFFDSRIDDVTLITRPQTLEDSVVPSGWSYAVQAIQRLNATQEDETHQSVIKISYQKVLGFIETGLLSNAVWLQNLLNTLYSLDYIVLVYPTDDIKNAREMEAFIRPHIHPELLFFALQKDDPLLGEIPILQEKKCVSNNATVYICVNHSCSNPINSLAELQKQFYSLIESW